MSALAARLRSVVPPGALLAPGAPGYEQARLVYNRMHDTRPAAIVRSLDPRVLRRAVAVATELGAAVAVRGGGHHIGGFSTVDGGLVLDFSVFRRVSYDPGTRTARVEPGARLGDLDAELAARGRCVPTGTVSDTGVVGLTLGGGIGWLVGAHGLTCDHLTGARVMTAGGAVLDVTADSHPDLFTALRGGGAGAFGVVLELSFRTVPLPDVVAGSVLVPLGAAAETLTRLAGLMRADPPTATTLAPVLGVHGLSVDLCCHDDHDRELSRLRALLGGDWSDVVARPYPSWQSHFDGLFRPSRGYWKSVHFEHLDLPPHVLVEAVATAPSPHRSVLVEYYNARTLRAHAPGSAYPLRGSRMGVLLSARWQDGADDEAHVAWARTWARRLRSAGGTKAYSNYSEAEDGGMRPSYDDDALALFRRLEAEYDPDRLFARGHRAALTSTSRDDPITR
ncbi:FAD-binding oxidoreductase [Actinosynnema sp. NPDC053489]|uniref:FAD-binding oxidoreductase n=1 Tax=Actinosynnema sp. NPDC053489 TaxID=3363916 RepID=UPI0037CC5DE4